VQHLTLIIAEGTGIASRDPGRVLLVTRTLLFSSTPSRLYSQEKHYKRWLRRPNGLGPLKIYPPLQLSLTPRDVIVHPLNIHCELGELEHRVDMLLLCTGQVGKLFPYMEIYRDSTKSGRQV
jgi:hypothetical protein